MGETTVERPWRVRRRIAWVGACLVGWAVAVPLVGVWAAVAGVIVPAAVFVRAAPLWTWAQHRDGARGKARVVRSWRVLADPERLVVLVLVGGVLGAQSWLFLGGFSVLGAVAVDLVRVAVLLAWVGALTLVPPGRRWRPEREAWTPAARPEVFVAGCALAGGAAFAFAAWYVRFAAVPIGRRTGSLVDGQQRAEDAIRWLDGQIAGSLFGVALDRPYLILIAAGAGVVAGGTAAALREAVVRGAEAGKVFEELADATEEGPAPLRSGKVFVSYSRRDSVVAERIQRALSDRIREVWVDWLGIEPSVQWRESIDEAIRSCDAMVVLLSEDALRSKYCWAECERAVELRKRILPVIIDPALETGASGALRQHGWDSLTEYQLLRMSAPERFEDGVARIGAFVEARHRWVAFHTRIGLRAHEWHGAGRSAGLLLRGHELLVARAWRRREPVDPEFRAGLTDLQRDFLASSHRAARLRAVRLRVTAVAAGVAMATLAGLVVSSETAAREERRRTDSQRLAKAADEQAPGDIREAALLSAAAYTLDDSAETRAALLRGVDRFDRVRGVLPARRAGIEHLTLSRDERLLIVWREDDTVEVWDTRTMRSRGTVKGARMTHREGGDLSADGRVLAVRQGVEAVFVDTRTLRPRHRVDLSLFGGVGLFMRAELTEDGRSLLVDPYADTGTEMVTQVDVATGRVVRSVVGDRLIDGARGREVAAGGGESVHPFLGSVPAVRLPRSMVLVGAASDGSLLMNDAGTLRVVDRRTGKVAWTLGKDLAGQAVTPDGRYALASGVDRRGRYEVWDLRERRRVGKVIGPGNLESDPSLRLSGDGRLLAVGTNALVESSSYTLYSVRTGRSHGLLPGHIIGLGPRGRLVAAATSMGTVTLFDHGPEGGNLRTRRAVPGAVGDSLSVAVRADLAALPATDGTVRVVRASNGRPVRTVRPASHGYLAALSPDGKSLAVAMVEGEGIKRQVYVDVHDVADGRRVKRLVSGGASAPRTAPATLAFSPDGWLLHLGEENSFSVYEWHTRTWRRGHRYGPDIDTGKPRRHAVSPDGSVIAVGGSQQPVQLWSTRTGKKLGKRLPRAGAVAFRPDGMLLTGGIGQGNPAVVLWDPRTRKPVAAAPDAGEQIVGVTVAPDGRTVVSVTGSGGLVLWDPELRRRIVVPKLRPGGGNALAFGAAPGRLLVARRGELLSLLVGADHWKAALCRIAGGPMSPARWQEAAPGERYRAVC
ncbi:toll/interleukin-1 receptor domain-containing protein [Streptomyces sp. NPDC000594]|uniref:toll/interleukin-1 receptor domain-containing protein n=1 Tax=Streptomyces sp. NPDC000594 TaxID=3154261 RepID=UPI00332DE2E5